MTCLERSAIRAARLQGSSDLEIADMLRSLRAQDAAAEDAAALAFEARAMDDDDFPRLRLSAPADDEAPRIPDAIDLT